MKRLLAPETIDGLIKPGSVIPSLGAVASIRPMLGLHDRIRGKFHENDAIYRLVSEEGRSYKAVVCKPQNGGSSSRTLEAARLLAQFPAESTVVPRVRYVDPIAIIVDYVPGQTLAKLPETVERISRLAQTIARNQPPLENAFQSPGLPDAVPLALRESGVLRESILESAEAILRSSRGTGTIPTAVCFFDSALKNYVESSAKRIAYIDLFGVAVRAVGAAFVRQILAISPGMRGVFWESYMSNSAAAEHIHASLSDYCLQHVVYRVISQYDPPEQAAKRNRYRRKKRFASFQVACDALRRCLELARSSEVFRQWLMSANL